MRAISARTVARAPAAEVQASNVLTDAPAKAIFAFTLSWNEFLYALVFIQDEKAITVPVGLNLLIYGDVFHWGQLMPASVITTIPVVALYVLIHRWMVEGLVAGSVKG
jgi:multiple sugar transport system permease protein